MKPITVTLALVCVACIVALSWILATPAPPDPRMAVLEAELKEARQTVLDLKQELSSRPPPPVPTALANAKVPQPGTDVADALSGKASASAADKGGGLREMLNNPGMRAMMEQQQAIQVEMSYARLFEFLQLSPEEKEHFKKLLTERQKAEMDLGLKMMDPKLTPDQRKQLTAQYEKQKQAFDATIKGFLNDDNDWKTFQHWEDTKPERTQYDMMGRSLFSASSEPLSQQQEQQLVDLMTEVRKTPGSSANIGAQTGMDPTRITADMIERQMKQYEDNAQVVSQRAAAFLSPVQMQTLKSYHEQLKTLSRSSIEMSQRLMGTGSGQ